MKWTPEKTALLRTMWAEGATCIQIAKRIGGVTRDGVSGKARFIGLPKRKTMKPRRPTQKPQT